MTKSELEKLLKEYIEENEVEELEVQITKLYKGKKVEVKCR